MNILADSGHKDTIAGECCSCRIDGFSFLFVFFDSGLIDRAVPLCKRIYILAHSPLDLCFPVCSHTHRQSTPHENINGSFPIWPPMRWNPISKVFICICAASTRLFALDFNIGRHAYMCAMGATLISLWICAYDLTNSSNW